ncbi:MAG: hypothetical protein EBV19_08080, partial [Flavobacteriia bacterium]|nr:hypothetical protein [Flavobacteriia bacterium]
MIGRGGFGKVYRVFNKLDDQHYAIKRILMTENSIKGALHEIRILARINHVNIVRYYNSWIQTKQISLKNDDPSFIEGDDESSFTEEDDIVIRHDQCFYFFIQMEFCQGTLKSYLYSRENNDNNMTICRQIIDGLHFLHTSGVIHRDMKTENILIYSYHPMHIKISDFGLAKVLSPTLNMTESTIYTGSYLYASPEQYKGISYSFSTDIYSLGIIFFELYS